MIPNHCCVVTNMMDEVMRRGTAWSKPSIRSPRAGKCADVLRFSSIPPLFDPAAISAETLAINAEIVARLNAEPRRPDDPGNPRAARCRASAHFRPRRNRRAPRRWRSPGRPARWSCASSRRRTRAGIYFHIHGGGWSIGAPDQNDPLLERIADVVGLTCVSVKYRLVAGASLSGRRPTIARRPRCGSCARARSASA